METESDSSIEAHFGERGGLEGWKIVGMVLKPTNFFHLFFLFTIHFSALCMSRLVNLDSGMLTGMRCAHYNDMIIMGGWLASFHFVPSTHEII